MHILRKADINICSDITVIFDRHFVVQRAMLQCVPLSHTLTQMCVWKMILQFAQDDSTTTISTVTEGIKKKVNQCARKHQQSNSLLLSLQKILRFKLVVTHSKLDGIRLMAFFIRWYTYIFGVLRSLVLCAKTNVCTSHTYSHRLTLINVSKSVWQSYLTHSHSSKIHAFQRNLIHVDVHRMYIVHE